MAIWVFMRHGHSVANREGWFSGHVDVPLTERGVNEALAARSLVDAVPLDRAFCSDLDRAHHTARIVLGDRDIPLRVVRDLRERDCGAWSKQPIAGLRDSGQLGTMFTWRGAPPGGESLSDVALRITSWLSTIDDSNDNTLIVAHGAALRSVVGILDEIPRDVIGRAVLKNCEMIQRDIAPGTWSKLHQQLLSED